MVLRALPNRVQNERKEKRQHKDAYDAPENVGKACGFKELLNLLDGGFGLIP